MKVYELGQRPKITESVSSARRAGIIPYYIDDNGDVLVYTMIPSDPDYGGTSPQMAKGHIDPGMDAYETAMKEGNEEIGLIRGNVIDVQVLGVYARIAVYICTVKNPNLWDKPHYETGWSGWVNLTKDFDSIRQEHKPIFMDLYNKVSP